MHMHDVCVCMHDVCICACMICVCMRMHDVCMCACMHDVCEFILVIVIITLVSVIIIVTVIVITTIQIQPWRGRRRHSQHRSDRAEENSPSDCSPRAREGLPRRGQRGGRSRGRGQLAQLPQSARPPLRRIRTQGNR